MRRSCRLARLLSPRPTLPQASPTGAWCGYGFHEDGIASAVRAVEALRALAARPQATATQRLALLEALQDVSWQAGWFGQRGRQDALMQAIAAAEEAALASRPTIELKGLLRS